MQRKFSEADNAPSIHRSSSSMKNHSEYGPTEKSNDANTSKYTRFEQLLKNIVGRKVSREAVQIGSNGYISEIVPSAQMASTLPDPKIRTSISSLNLTREDKMYSAPDDNNFMSATETCGKNQSTHMTKYSFDARCMNTPLLSKSPKIRISKAPSAHSLCHNEKCINTTTSSASTTSLNATMQHRLWSVVPLLRRDGSCSSLNQSSSRLLIQQRNNMTLKKCETVSALSHSQTTSSFEPIKARNRLRLSQSIATCSRCSSILSLAANGSRYSLNIANGGFVAIRSNLCMSYLEFLIFLRLLPCIIDCMYVQTYKQLVPNSCTKKKKYIRNNNFIRRHCEKAYYAFNISKDIFNFPHYYADSTT